MRYLVASIGTFLHRPAGSQSLHQHSLRQHQKDYCFLAQAGLRNEGFPPRFFRACSFFPLPSSWAYPGHSHWYMPNMCRWMGLGTVLIRIPSADPPVPQPAHMTIKSLLTICVSISSNTSTEHLVAYELPFLTSLLVWLTELYSTVAESRSPISEGSGVSSLALAAWLRIILRRYLDLVILVGFIVLFFMEHVTFSREEGSAWKLLRLPLLGSFVNPSSWP